MVSKNPSSAFMLFFMVFSLVAPQFLVAVMRQTGISNDIFRSLWFLIVIQLVCFVLPLFIWVALTRDKLKRHLPNQPLGGLNIIFILLLSFLMLPAMWLISGITSLFVTNDVAEFMSALGTQPWWLMMLAIAVTPGIVEELVFRGYIQSTQHGRNFITIALMNGLLFGIMHLNRHQFFYTFVLGVIFAYMVYHTRSIWAGIIPHFIVNGVNVTLSYFAISGLPEYANGAPIEEQTFAEALYEALVETNPALAQSVYEWAVDINPVVIAVISMAIVTAFTLPLAGVAYHFFVSHNRKRNAGLEEESEKEATEQPQRMPFRMDWCLVAVMLIYVIIVFAIPALEARVLATGEYYEFAASLRGSAPLSI